MREGAREGVREGVREGHMNAERRVNWRPGLQQLPWVISGKLTYVCIHAHQTQDCCPGLTLAVLGHPRKAYINPQS